MFRQNLAAVEVILGNVRANLGEAIVTVIGVAGVVGVLVTVLAMAQGFQHALTATGHADRAIILSKGTTSESSSNLSRDAALKIVQDPGIKKDLSGTPIVSLESLAQLRLPLRAGGMGTATLRGVGPLSHELRPETRIIKGRTFQRGVHELVVGQSLAAQFQGLEVGDRIAIQNQPWTIVGHFAVEGDGQLNSEVMGDAAVLQSAYHRSDFQSVTVALENFGGMAKLTAALAADPSFSVDVHREDQYYADQSKTITRILTIVGFFVASIMALGAFFATLNTMYAVVAKQSLLIATLRAIGFGTVAVINAVLVESFFLALLGAMLGIVAAIGLFHGHMFHVTPGARSDLFYSFQISPRLSLLGVAWALVIGFLGGLFPAIRAARLPIAEALRIT